MLEYNVNSEVKVRLTDFGVEILRDMRQYHGVSYSVTPDKNNCIKEPLWKIMQIFGAHISMGISDAPFETVIQIKEEDVKRKDDTTTKKESDA